MLLLISPAKTLDFEKTDLKKKTKPRFLPESQELIDVLKTKKASDIKKLMKWVAAMARSRQTSVMLLSPTSMSFMSCVTWKVRDACWEVASFLGKETVVPVRLVHRAVQWNS